MLLSNLIENNTTFFSFAGAALAQAVQDKEEGDEPYQIVAEEPASGYHVERVLKNYVEMPKKVGKFISSNMPKVHSRKRAAAAAREDTEVADSTA